MTGIAGQARADDIVVDLTQIPSLKTEPDGQLVPGVMMTGEPVVALTQIPSLKKPDEQSTKEVVEQGALVALPAIFVTVTLAVFTPTVKNLTEQLAAVDPPALQVFGFA